MNWLTTFHLAEGPGIAKDAPKRKGLALVLETMWREGFDLMKLNLIFCLACLPLVTVPAAFAALMRVTLTMAEDRNVYLVEDFLAAFRETAGPATALGVMIGTLGALALYAVRAYGALATENLAFAAPLALAASVTVFISIAGTYAFAILAASRLGLVRVVSLSFRAALMRPGRPLLALTFCAGLWLVHILFYPVTLAMPVLINFAFGTLVLAFSVAETVNRLVRAQEERSDLAGEPVTGRHGQTSMGDET